MLLVKTKLSTSCIAGIGLFALEPVKSGTIIWKENPLTDKRYSDTEWNELKHGLPKEQFDTFSRFMYFLHGVWILNLDDSRFMNHSVTPNLGYNREFDTCFALRNIKIGEELTIDYRTFCDKSEDTVCKDCGLC